MQLTERSEGITKQILTLIAALVPIERQLQEKKCWPAERAKNAMDGYARYLTLLLRHPNTPVVPSEDIDEVWHAHILWTERYGGDCQDIFGRFIHHYPCFNLDDPVERAEQYENRETTTQLFFQEFGEIPESYNYGAGTTVSPNSVPGLMAKSPPPPPPPPCGGCNCYRK